MRSYCRISTTAVFADVVSANRFTAGNLSKVDVGSMTTTVLTVMQKLPDGDPAVAQCLSTLGHILKVLNTF
jgi:hypothetical protein